VEKTKSNNCSNIITGSRYDLFCKSSISSDLKMGFEVLEIIMYVVSEHFTYIVVTYNTKLTKDITD